MIRVKFITDTKSFFVDCLDNYISHKNKRNFGNVVPNTADFSINNSDNIFAWDLANKIFKILVDGEYLEIPELCKIEIYVEDDLDFTGYIDYPSENFDTDNIDFHAKDFWYFIENTQCEEKPYLSTEGSPITFDYILKDLLSMAGYTGSLTNIYPVTEVIDYYHITEDNKVSDIIKKMMEASGGAFWFDSSGNANFDGGFFAWKSSTPSYVPITTITEDDFVSPKIEKNPKEYNRVKVSTKTYKKNTEQEWVYVGYTPDSPLTIGTDTNLEFTVEFDKLVYYAVMYKSPYTWFQALFNSNLPEFLWDTTDNSKVDLDETTYNSNFYDLVNGILKNPSSMNMKVNVTGEYVGVQVTDFRFMGKTIEEQEWDFYLGTVPEGSFDRVKEYTLDIVQNEQWLEDLATWYKKELDEKIILKLTLQEIVLGEVIDIDTPLTVVIPDKQINGVFKVNSIFYNYDRGEYDLELELVYSSFSPSTETKNQKINSKGLNNLQGYYAPLNKVSNLTQEYAEKFAKTAPAIPTGLTLSSSFVDRKALLNTSWNANSETYHKGYEVWISYDNINFSLALFTETPSCILEVEPDKLVYIKIRAVSYDSYFSSFSSVKSITSAKSTTPIATGTVSAYAGFGRVLIYWSKSNNLNLTGYKIERNKDSSGWVVLNTTENNNYTDNDIVTDSLYQYRITVVDIFGNESTTTESNTVTGKAQIITTEITNDSISTPKLQANSVTADKLYSLILEAGKYIQSGTENDGYRLHGTYGLQRLKNQNVFNIPSIMAKSSVSLGTNTSKIITLPFALTSYDVNLNLTKFKYWDSGFQTNQNRDLIVSWDYISSTQFRINAYTQVSNTYVTVNQKIYIPGNNTYTDLYQTSNCLNAKVALGNSYSHNENYVYSHTYITAGSYLIKLKRVFAYGTYYNWTIDWGDGSTQLLQGIEGNIGYAYMLGYYQGTIIQSANAEIQYAVIGY